MVLPVEPAVGRGPSCCSSSYSHAALPRPHAVRGCTCGTCPAVTSAAAVAGLLRETLGGRARTRGFGFFGMGGEGGELPAGAAADVPVFDLSDKAIEDMWMRVKKQLFSVGKGGVKPSHVRSLNTLIAAHTLVKVKINIPNADLEEVGLELAGKGGAAAATLGGGVEDESSSGVDISVVTVKPNQKTILFANTEFLTAQARGEVFNNERPTAVPE
ncbi:unnamed protein product [Pylaiella littoralis]